MPVVDIDRCREVSAPLVYLQGPFTFPGAPYAKAWADGFRVYVPDHPGFGASSDDETISDMQDYVLHYLDLLDRWGVQTFCVVGHSTGGWLAAKFASIPASDPREFSIHLIKNLGHQYPNGTNHPMHGARKHWEWFRQFTLP